MRKAQTAMEFLMTYGWVAIIILIVLAALFSLGGFNPNINKGICNSEVPFSCTDIKLGENTDSLSLSLRASGVKYIGYNINNAVKINDVNCPITDDGDPAPNNLDEKMVNAKTAYVEVKCDAGALNLIKDDEFSGSIILDYTEINGLMHNAEITFNGLVE